MVEPKRTPFKGHFLNIYETKGVILGFTECDFSPDLLTQRFHEYRLIDLKQVHSNIIHFSSRLEPGAEGDGIILDQPGIIAVIRTADCTPLFFWDTEGSIGGVIHIGWQGLLKGIENELLKRLEEKSIDINRLYFYMGPGIEKNCYEVGRDLYERFSCKHYREDIFSIHETKKDKFRMDVKKGIRLSLKESGILDSRVSASPLCTYCEPGRFPSFRRDPASGGRIYNFLAFTPQSRRKSR